MKTRLFDEKENWTTNGDCIRMEFEKAIGAIFGKYEDIHSMRELQYIAEAALTSEALDRILRIKYD